MPKGFQPSEGGTQERIAHALEFIAENVGQMEEHLEALRSNVKRLAGAVGMRRS